MLERKPRAGCFANGFYLRLQPNKTSRARNYLMPYDACVLLENEIGSNTSKTPALEPAL